MSRRKVGYDFVPVPEDISPEWARLPFQTRMLGIALWMLGRGEPIPVPSGDWTTYLCGKLEVSGPDRPNISRALNRLVDAGLLTVCDGSARCLLRVCQVSAPGLRPVCGVSAERKSANQQQVTPTEEIRREEKRVDEMSARVPERATAPEPRPPIDTSKLQQRPEDVGFRFVASLLGRSTFDVAPVGSYPREYAWIGSRPPEERERIRSAVEAEEYFVENPAWCDAKKLATDWQKLLAGRPKPLARTVAIDRREQLEKARERLQDAAKTLRIIEGLPWFDKEKPTYPERLAKATADVSRLRGELAKLESGFTRPAVAS